MHASGHQTAAGFDAVASAIRRPCRDNACSARTWPAACRPPRRVRRTHLLTVVSLRPCRCRASWAKVDGRESMIEKIERGMNKKVNGERKLKKILLVNLIFINHFACDQFAYQHYLKPKMVNAKIKK
jgi:hypothetical protein